MLPGARWSGWGRAVKIVNVFCFFTSFGVIDKGEGDALACLWTRDALCKGGNVREDFCGRGFFADEAKTALIVPADDGALVGHGFSLGVFSGLRRRGISR